VRGSVITHYPRITNISEYSEFTGISAPYEPPLDAELHIKTAECEVKEAVQIITNYLLEKGYITAN
jgi:adenylylsulfate kinase